jgi:ketosteroid isomerase-like protein
MRRSFAILTLTSLFAMPALAAETASLQSDFDALVATERAFSQLSQDKGMKEAFFTYIADDGILFRGGAFVQGKAWTQARPNPPATLKWWPTQAGISASGDLGWDTGPYEVRANGSTEVGYGNFVTVWKKQADGNWRFAIDFGNDYATPTGDKSTPSLPAGKTRATASKTDPAALKDSLLTADRELGQATGAGTAAAYKARFTDDGMMLRSGVQPYMGKAAVHGALDAQAAAMTSQPIDGGVSAAGDMGYTYGTAEWKKGEATVKGNYIRIWEKHDGVWKLRVDVLNEAAPPPPPPAAPKQGS